MRDDKPSKIGDRVEVDVSGRDHPGVLWAPGTITSRHWAENPGWELIDLWVTFDGDEGVGFLFPGDGDASILGMCIPPDSPKLRWSAEAEAGP